MKKFKFFGLALAVLALVGLASCGDKPAPEPTGPTAEEVLAGFNPNVTTLTATYESKYTLKVNSDNASFKAFEEDVNETTKIDLDLTAGNLYLYAKNGEKEVLLVKDASGYKYITTEMVEYGIVADDAAAKTKINELLKEITFRKAGWLTLDSLTYDIDEYAHREFMLSTLNIPAEDVEEPTMTVTEGKGLSAAYTLEYVCFTGDSGIFELKETQAGSNTATVVTDSTGLVTSSKVTFNAHTSLALTQAGVPLDLAGTRTLTATHGATITKKTEIAHATEAKKVAVTVTEAQNGTYTVAWFDYAKGSFTMNPVANGDQVEVGMWLGIKVTPAEGYKVAAVKVNGATTQVVVQGIYCFEVKDQAQTTEVTFVPEAEEVVTDATIIFEQPEHATLAVSYLDYANGGAGAPQTALNSGDKFTVDKTSYWLCFVVTPEEGYELDKILVNGKEASNYGAWLYSIKEAGEYTIVVTLKSTGSSDNPSNPGQASGMKYTGQFGPQPVEFTFDLATSTGTYSMAGQTYTFDFTNNNGVVSVSNFTCEQVTITSITFAQGFATAEVVAAYMGQGATFTITKVKDSTNEESGNQNQSAGMKYTGNFGGFVDFIFTFDLSTGKGTFTMQNKTDTFDFTQEQGLITITNFTSTSLVIKSASISQDYQTLTVVASFNGGADATMTGTYTK